MGSPMIEICLALLPARCGLFCLVFAFGILAPILEAAREPELPRSSSDEAERVSTGASGLTFLGLVRSIDIEVLSCLGNVNQNREPQLPLSVRSVAHLSLSITFGDAFLIAAAQQAGRRGPRPTDPKWLRSNMSTVTETIVFNESNFSAFC